MKKRELLALIRKLGDVEASNHALYRKEIGYLQDQLRAQRKVFESFRKMVIGLREGDNKSLNQFSEAIGDLKVRLSVVETKRPRKRTEKANGDTSQKA